jgi:acetoin utilization protein AcuB
MLKLVDKPVLDIMTRSVVTVSPDTTVEVVKNIFDTQNIHHIPVVHNAILMGIISKIDVYRMTHCIDLFRSKDNAALNQHLLETLLAEDIMTRTPTVLAPDDSINYAAELFSRNDFHALPVVSGEKLIGILTTYDLIQYTFGKQILRGDAL